MPPANSVGLRSRYNPLIPQNEREIAWVWSSVPVSVSVDLPSCTFISLTFDPTAVCISYSVCCFCCFVWLTPFIVCLCRCVCVCCLCLVQIRAAFPSCFEEALAFNLSSVSLCQEIHNQGFIYQAVLALEKRFIWSESEWEALQSAGGQLYSRPAASSVCVVSITMFQMSEFLRCADIKHRSS